MKSIYKSLKKIGLDGYIPNYKLDGITILKETRGSSAVLYYYYDSSVSIIAFSYNATLFAFISRIYIYE
ncbi:MAG: hypothetical protein PHV07_02635 [Oscillospiraceae bacterium]|nr:hypothetical protein [Oscillospiraceae bacterium]